MREAETTTRRRIADRLREEPAELSTLAEEFDATAGSVCSHITHLVQSLDNGSEELLVAGPTCRDCGFSGFDDRINRPSRCPECKSESIEEPAFTIEQ